jgi:uncharacterized membrane protein (DUF2068 family)
VQQRSRFKIYSCLSSKAVADCPAIDGGFASAFPLAFRETIWYDPHPMNKQHRSDFLLRLIVLEKGVLGVLALLLSAGLLSLMNRDLASLVIQLADALNLNVDNRFLKLTMTQLMDVKVSTLVGVSVVGFVYSVLNFVEAFGLAMRQRWAEYLTVIATALFIPFEVYQLFVHLTLFRVTALIINILIVAFLIRHTEMF